MDDFVAKVLAEVEKGDRIRADDLIARVERKYGRREHQVRDAIWKLLTSDKLILTSDRHLELPQEATAR